MATVRVDLAGAALGVVGLVGAWMLTRAPVEASRERASALEAEVAAAAEEASSLEAEAAGLRERASALEAELEATRVDLKPGSSVNAQIARIAELAQGTSLRLSEIRPGEGSVLSTHMERPVVLRGRAPFAALIGFVREVEDRFADLGVRSLSVSRGAEGEEPSFEVTLVWFADRSGP